MMRFTRLPCFVKCDDAAHKAGKNHPNDLDAAWTAEVERIYYVRERAGIIKTSRQRGSKDRSRLGERQTPLGNSLGKLLS